MKSIPKSYFTGKLWQKEPNDDSFVEFLPDVTSILKESPKTLNWIVPHRFLDKRIEPLKNERIAIDFRVQGNGEFKKRNWRAAMELYNQSLRFAGADSENISLAYANRSSCFLHMKKYTECLNDIEMAKENGYPNRLMQKLNDREIACLAKLTEGLDIQAETEPKLSFDPDANFPCMANVLEIQSNEEFGRHIVAKCDIDVGQTVLVEEPFVCVADIFDRTLCSSCFKAIKNFIPCQSCTDAMFCDEECMRNDENHKITCGSTCDRTPASKLLILSIVCAVNALPNVDDLMDFVAKQLASPRSDLPKSCPDARSKYGMFLKLNVLPTETNQTEIITVELTYRCIMNIPALNALFDSEKRRRFLQHLIWQHRLIIANALAKSLYYGSIAVAGNLQAFFNHSCMPNLHWAIVPNKKLYCITVRPVKKGEQLFIMYNDVGFIVRSSTEERQKFLLEKFHFKCKCARCVPTVRWIDQLQMIADPVTQFFTTQNLTNGKVSTIKQKCYEFMRKYGHLESCDETAVVMYNLTPCIDEDYPEFSDRIF